MKDKIAIASFSRSEELPTEVQALKAIVLCQWLSNGYQPINVFRYDSQLKTLYIQAGVTDGIALIILADGNWRFI